MSVYLPTQQEISAWEPWMRLAYGVGLLLMMGGLLWMVISDWRVSRRRK